MESKVSHFVVTTTSPDVDGCRGFGTAGIDEKFPTDRLELGNDRGQSVFELPCSWFREAGCSWT
ncbi:hypothetical protein HanXRQr2_Chr07g0316461 [Helianthus annuus]|uniref:Uncharacterized protein n=1 Tax=Helianthus annuus TaxID=4232 RepID=A0A9K3NHC3_HELAN|nr:hypothetical protein HanXRQr2_Chr07g0316461 [Helianthus annuus]